MFTDSQKVAIAYAPKPLSLISLILSIKEICRIYRSPKKKETRLFRLVILKLFTFSALLSCCHFIGTWAIPIDSPNAVGAIGTDVSCKVQGFLINTIATSMIGYYLMLVLISYIAVRFDFDEKKYKRIANFMDFLVLMVPILLSIWTLEKDYFHEAGAWCWVQSSPLGCNIDSDIDCVHQVDNGYSFFLIGTNLFIVCVMNLVVIILYSDVTKIQVEKCLEAVELGQREKKHEDFSKMALVQSVAFSLAFYASFALSVVARTVEWKKESIYFSMTMMCIITYSLQGIYLKVAFNYVEKATQDQSTSPST